MQETQEIQVRSVGCEDSLEEETATHSSIFAWRIPWTEEPGRLQSTGLQESDTTECTHAHAHTHTRWSDQFGFFKEFFKIFYVPVVLLCFKLAMILLLKYIYFSTFHEIWCRIWNTCKCSIRRLTQSGSLNSQAILFPLFRWFGIELEVCQTWNIFCRTKFIHLYLILVHAWELSHSAVVWLFGTP